MSPAPPAPRLVRFAAFEFDCHTLELRKHGLRIKLSGQPMEVLALLLARPGELVSREDLQRRLWPHDTIVEFEHSINAAINRLREALDDSADEPRYIETLSRRGYRFIPRIEPAVSLQLAIPPFDPGQPAGLDAPRLPSPQITVEEKAQEPFGDLSGRTVSHYRVVSRIGGGGMGIVYRAQDTKLPRWVALKFLPPELASNPQALSRFEREWRTASTLNHPNICTIHDIDKHEGRPFIAMELLEGETLRNHLALHPLSMSEIIQISMQIAFALEAAHVKGIIHRDIKPANIFITRERIAKILDFGLAKAVKDRSATEEPVKPGWSASQTTEESVTAPGEAIGTVAYMSPEQLRGERLDSRTDLFSFGAVLYEMASGKQAFSGQTRDAISDAVKFDDPAPLQQANPKVPAEFTAIVKKALQKDRSKRYVSASALRSDLENLAGSVRVPYFGPRPRFIRRRAGVVADIVAFLLAVSAALLVGRNVPALREWLLGETTTPRIQSLAVLPLTNLSGDPEQEYFADGMTEALIAQLSQISAVRVISRTSVMRYKRNQKTLPEIARELKVDAVVEGSVLREGDQVRVMADLVDAPGDRHLWTHSYQRALRDVLALQADLAQTIAQEIQIKLSPQEKMRISTSHAVKPEAYEAYLRGRYFWNKRDRESVMTGLKYFQQAVEIDPTYPLAYVGVADSYILLSNKQLAPQEALSEAKTAAMRALEIDPKSAEAHTSLALIKQQEWDWRGAAAEYESALLSNPGYAIAHQWYSLLLAETGRFAEAVQAAQKAAELDPLSPIIGSSMGEVLYVCRRFEEAEREFKRTLETSPDFFVARTNLGLVYLQQGKLAESIADLQASAKLSRQDITTGALAYAYALAGRKSDAIQVLTELKRQSGRRYVSPYLVAQVCAGLNKKAEAFEWLEKAYQQRDADFPWIRADPMLDPLRPDPRLDDLIARLNFPK